MSTTAWSTLLALLYATAVFAASTPNLALVAIADPSTKALPITSQLTSVDSLIVIAPNHPELGQAKLPNLTVLPDTLELSAALAQGQATHLVIWDARTVSISDGLPRNLSVFLQGTECIFMEQAWNLTIKGLKPTREPGIVPGIVALRQASLAFDTLMSGQSLDSRAQARLLHMLPQQLRAVLPRWRNRADRVGFAATVNVSALTGPAEQWGDACKDSSLDNKVDALATSTLCTKWTRALGKHVSSEQRRNFKAQQRERHARKQMDSMAARAQSDAAAQKARASMKRAELEAWARQEIAAPGMRKATAPYALEALQAFSQEPCAQVRMAGYLSQVSISLQPFGDESTRTVRAQVAEDGTASIAQPGPATQQLVERDLAALEASAGALAPAPDTDPVQAAAAQHAPPYAQYLSPSGLLMPRVHNDTGEVVWSRAACRQNCVLSKRSQLSSCTSVHAGQPLAKCGVTGQQHIYRRVVVPALGTGTCPKLDAQGRYVDERVACMAPPCSLHSRVELLFWRCPATNARTEERGLAEFELALKQLGAATPGAGLHARYYWRGMPAPASHADAYASLDSAAPVWLLNSTCGSLTTAASQAELPSADLARFQLPVLEPQQVGTPVLQAHSTGQQALLDIRDSAATLKDTSTLAVVAAELYGHADELLPTLLEKLTSITPTLPGVQAVQLHSVQYVPNNAEQHAARQKLADSAAAAAAQNDPAVPEAGCLVSHVHTLASIDHTLVQLRDGYAMIRQHDAATGAVLNISQMLCGRAKPTWRASHVVGRAPHLFVGEPAAYPNEAPTNEEGWMALRFSAAIPNSCYVRLESANGDITLVEIVPESGWSRREHNGQTTLRWVVLNNGKQPRMTLGPTSPNIASVTDTRQSITPAGLDTNAMFLQSTLVFNGRWISGLNGTLHMSARVQVQPPADGSPVQWTLPKLPLATLYCSRCQLLTHAQYFPTPEQVQALQAGAASGELVHLAIPLEAQHWRFGHALLPPEQLRALVGKVNTLAVDAVAADHGRPLCKCEWAYMMQQVSDLIFMVDWTTSIETVELHHVGVKSSDAMQDVVRSFAQDCA